MNAENLQKALRLYLNHPNEPSNVTHNTYMRVASMCATANSSP